MNIWAVATIVILIAMAPAAVLLARTRRLIEWYIAMQWAGTLGVLLLVAMARVVERPAFIDLALALALVDYVSSLLLVTVIERWL
ncbi:MAG TPA: monovalent cation/H+ antiporter complex subunit F [Pirellulales bacterium]|nr:monovalent cation/H+ antiporter complex subunit F [Pirellulales bacterium]